MIQGSSECTQHPSDAGRFDGLRLEPNQLRSLAFDMASKLSYPIFGIVRASVIHELIKTGAATISL